MKQLKKTAIALGAAQLALMASGIAFAQSEPTTVTVVGQRAALESAQKIKQNADEIVDSVVADDIGKLPDKSVTEVLQRIVGVTIDRTMNRVDPQQGVGDGIQHFAAEGTGVSIRGLSYVRSELNGRDSFSANGGRSLSFEDVPPELMAGVDVYKNPSAEQVEGGIGGLVNLRTALPFDFKGRKGALSVEAARSDLRGKTSPSFSGMLSDRWDTGLGQFGALIDVAHSRINTRSDGISVGPYIPRNNIVVGDTSGKTRWAPGGMGFTTNNFARDRDGLYGALQWKKDTLSSSLTYFRSKYKINTTENSFFQGGQASVTTLDPGATFDDQGALLTGVLRDPSEGGVNVGTAARATGRTADTRDISWNLSWRASSQWTLRTDLQQVKATTEGYDNTVGLGGFIPKETLNLGASPIAVSFDDSDRAALLNPANYYWGFTQEHRDKADGTLKTARIDAKYTFDDPVLNDLRFGLRATEREALTRSTHDTEWTQISQPWAVSNAPGSWQPLSQFAYLSDPRFTGNTGTQGFSNFFGGQFGVPAVIVPNMALTTNVPTNFAMLHNYTQLVCKTPCSQAVWTPAPYGDATGLNEQHERTKAAYAQLRFGFDKWQYPVDGNVGVRVVHTDMTAGGYQLFSPPTSTVVGVPVIPAQSQRQDFDNSYNNVLPSLNLRMKTSEQLQFRAALSKGMTRPDFWQMQTYTTLSQNVHTHQDPGGQPVLDSIDYTGSAKGNPLLKPTLSNNFDLTGEYYFGRSSSFTVALFNKQIKDIIIGQTTSVALKDTTGASHDFLITSPVNGAKGRATGLEIGYQQYFDKLPGWMSGFGVSGNYTYIDSRQSMYKPLNRIWCTPKGDLDSSLAATIGGCDTDGRVLNATNLPMTGMSKNAFNLALLYDRGPVSARVAYSWRSKYLQAANAYGANGSDGVDANPNSGTTGQVSSVNYALPVWGGAYGQVDMGIHYKIAENLNLAFEARNLTNALFKQYMQQNIGFKEKGAFYTGRSYTLQAQYSF
ncbi:TonB-dependent receptor [Duganella sp.]|uniref:TonB-dependent receptor n=1 Tax=Duganella sp. TaxID=1904440 RepID=UPI0031E23859